MGKLSSYALKDPLVLADEIGAILDSEEPLDADKNKRATLQVLQDILLSDIPLIDFTGDVPAHKEGRIYYDITKHNHVALNDVIDVALDLGLEVWVRVYNDTGAMITNGQTCYISDINVGTDLQEVSLAVASSLSTSDVIGWATHDMEDQSIGYIVAFGELNEVNTVGFTLGAQLFLSATVPGGKTETSPLPPDQILPIGRVMKVDAVGKIFAKIGELIVPTPKTVTGGFSSSGGVTGVDNFVASHYVFGPSVTPSGPGDNLGAAAEMHGSHAFVVLGAASTDMIIQVSGDSWDEVTETIADTQNIDTSGGALNDYFETPLKWNGIVNFSLLSGTPVLVNIGFSYYMDNGNKRFILTNVVWSGVAGAADAGPDLQIRKHSPANWTYTGAGAIPPPPLIDLQSTLTNGALVNGDEFAFKLTGFSEVIEGDLQSGLIISINYNANNSILTSNLSLNILN